ncbi:MAG: hypothetical protein Q7K35_03960, partial [bacterium]|nr:hypothetical protein [bacterium]
VLGNYFWDKDKADLYKPMRINPGIWGSIVMAKLFEIPQEIIYACINSILDKYFPTVDKMGIQFNELTSIGDIKYIWKKVERQQRGFIIDHRINIQDKYLNHDRDKEAYKLNQKNPNFSNEEILAELSKNKKFNVKIKPATVPVIIRTYKKFINQ